MKNNANEIFIKFIQQHRSPLCSTPEKSMFNINVSENIGLGLFYFHGRIDLLCSYKGKDMESTVSFNNFTSEENFADIVFSYNELYMQAYVDKRKATKKGGMVFGMTLAEDENNMPKEIFEQLYQEMENLCNIMVGMTLSVLEQLFLKESLGISLADFGYINFKNDILKEKSGLKDFKIKEGVLVQYTGGGGDVMIPDGVTSIGDSAFRGCESLTSISIPDSVTGIGNFAFEDCTSLTSISIPSGVTSIGYSAFCGCTALHYNIYGNVKYLGNESNPYLVAISTTNSRLEIYEIHEQTKIIKGYAFAWCKSLTSISIPDSVTSIGDSAFYDCKSLTTISISNGVTNIGDSAFSDCTSLTSVSIPNSITSIGKYAFDNCDSLTSVYYRGTEEEWEALSEMGIGMGNSYVTNATRYYYSESTPTTTGNYWHYDENGDSVVW